MSRPSAARTLLRGLARRCPRCGSSRVFRRWLWMVERCPGCGLRFSRVSGHWTGAVGLNLFVTEAAFAAVLLAALVATWPDPPYGWILVAGLATTVVVPLVAHPFTKTVWTAIDLLMRPLELDEILDAAAHGTDDLGSLLADAELDAARDRARHRPRVGPPDGRR